MATILPGYTLPLMVELRSASRSPTGAFTMEVAIANSGTSPFLLPVATDPKRPSMLPGNTGRRLLQFGATFQAPGQPETQFVVGRTTEGSQTGKDSLLQLSPKQSVIVRFIVNPSEQAVRLIKDNPANTTVRAVLIEKSFEDSRWYLRETSSPTLSDNSLPVRQ